MPDSNDDLKDVLALESCWERLCAAAHQASEAELQRLVAKWGDRRQGDPICLSTDLLSPLGQERREVTHTQILAHFFDPQATHGLGSAPLEALIAYLKTLLGDQEVQETEAFATLEELVDATVESERAIRLQREGAVERPRTDLWIEIPRTAPKAIIVIENKIDDQARPNQLKLYEQVLKERLDALRRQRPPPQLFRIYLTLSGEPPSENAAAEQWLCASYWVLAHVLMPLLDEAPSLGREMLRLYLATIFQKLYGLTWEEQPSAVRRGELISYLRLRLESLE